MSTVYGRREFLASMGAGLASISVSNPFEGETGEIRVRFYGVLLLRKETTTDKKPSVEVLIPNTNRHAAFHHPGELRLARRHHPRMGFFTKLGNDGAAAYRRESNLFNTDIVLTGKDGDPTNVFLDQNMIKLDSVLPRFSVCCPDHFGRREPITSID
jgi:hypothetical protein